MIWGGDKDCKHQWGNTIISKSKSNWDTFEQYRSDGGGGKRAIGLKVNQGNFCSLCSAWKGQSGLEPTPEMFIEHIVEIFREVRRVLRKDGVCFLNIGDSYFGGQGGSHDYRQAQSLQKVLKPKDMCLIPQRLTIALQEDGWWVRSIIIWSKTNPMPESVTDRPTETHEYILMLTKSKNYYWDAKAVLEKCQPSTFARLARGKYSRYGPNSKGKSGEYAVRSEKYADPNLGRNIRSVWQFATEPFSDWLFDYEHADYVGDNGKPYIFSEDCPVHWREPEKGIQKRSVNGHKSYSDYKCTCRISQISHFAAFPEKLPEICIKAATPEVGCCSKCGKPWERLTEESRIYYAKDVGGKSQFGGLVGGKQLKDRYSVIRATLGWQAGCHCQQSAQIPSLVLDPFAGTGTVGWVAKKLGRKAVLYELSSKYVEFAIERNRQSVLWTEGSEA